MIINNKYITLTTNYLYLYTLVYIITDIDRLIKKHVLSPNCASWYDVNKYTCINCVDKWLGTIAKIN